MVAFSLGSATIILALAYGTRGLIAQRRDLLAKLMPLAKPIMGWAMLIVGLAIVFRLDRWLEGAVLALLPAEIVSLSVSL